MSDAHEDEELEREIEWLVKRLDRTEQKAKACTKCGKTGVKLYPFIGLFDGSVFALCDACRSGGCDFRGPVNSSCSSPSPQLRLLFGVSSASSSARRKT